MIPLFDAHCDTILAMLHNNTGLKSNYQHISLDRAVNVKPYAQFFAVFGVTGKFSVSELVSMSLNKFMDEIDKNSSDIVLCRTKSEAEAAFADKKAAAFLSVEGADLIDCSVGRLHELYMHGVRAVNLTWNNANELSGTNVQDSGRGLSAKGREFVKACNDLGVIIDVSHLSDAGFWDVCENSSAPFMASHSNSRSVFEHTRNITDDMFKALVSHGGLSGINLYADFVGENADIETLCEHIFHFLELGGEKSIAIGSDFDGCERLCGGIHGIEDMEKLYEHLLRRGVSESTAQDIFFNNMMELVSKVCGI